MTPDRLPTSAPFLPIAPEESHARGWGELDVVLVTGDAYVDHPSFPAALLGRVLEAEGLRVGLLPRPDPGDDSIARLGEPCLFFAVSAGAVDSLVSNYTAQKKRRSDDAYAPGGRGGGRPDRATIAYANAIRRVFGRHVPVLAGGVEVSLRRFAHDDYWSDSVRRPILLDAPVDALVYGMGERPLREIVRRLGAGFAQVEGPEKTRAFVEAVREVRGVVYRTPASEPPPEGYTALPTFEEVRDDPTAHCRAFVDEARFRSTGVYQESAGKRVLANPPAEPLTTEELDALYALPFQRCAHPSYRDPIPALAQVQFSVTAHRGCYGGCAFCGIGAHQGKTVRSRSRESVLAEVEAMTRHPEFRGTVRDVGGPTANMWGSTCARDESCDRPSCLTPSRCPNLRDGQEAYRRLLEAAAEVPGVKHLFVSSGIRMDLALGCEAFARQLILRHTSGHLKVAPEHVVPRVLELMRKPEPGVFREFLKLFARVTRRGGRKQYVLPYFIAAHPGARIEDAVEVALFMKEWGLRVEQCQIFTPLPGTAAAVMYATGLDPWTGKKVFVERDPRRREMQKALILWRQPESRKLVVEALRLAGRMDLAGVLTRRTTRRTAGRTTKSTKNTKNGGRG